MLTDSRCRTAWRAACAAPPGVLLAVFAPKCPLCVAAYLSSLGIGVGLVRQTTTWLSLLWAAAICGALALGVRWMRRRNAANDVPPAAMKRRAAGCPLCGPSQELGTGNHRAFAALDPCKKDGDKCNSGIDGCGGSCYFEDVPELVEPVGSCSPKIAQAVKSGVRRIRLFARKYTAGRVNFLPGPAPRC
jgi:hypothetical protein